MSSAIIVGDPEPRSAVWRAARLLVTTVTGTEPATQIDLAEIGVPLFRSGDETVSEAVAAISDCNFLVVASPVVRGSYSGLLKLFLDRVPAGALARVTAVPLMVGSDPQAHHGSRCVPSARPCRTGCANTERVTLPAGIRALQPDSDPRLDAS